MNPLKEIDFDLAKLLESANEPSWQSAFSRADLIDEELLCCCERAHHAIKGFTTEGPEEDRKISVCLPVAEDALCDLEWCLGKVLSRHGYNVCKREDHGSNLLLLGSVKIEVRKLRELLRSICWAAVASFLPKQDPFFLPKKEPSFSYNWDARNASGSAHLPPGLNVDDIDELQYLYAVGDGSQGVVYAALWGEQKVAVKEVHCGMHSDGLAALELVMSSTGRASASRGDQYCELDVLKTINHPNIVELNGYTTMKCRAVGSYGLVMELMEGSLKDLIQKPGELSDLMKVDTLLQVARGMRFLHRIGIMHRDLKPANILIKQLTYLPAHARRLSYVVAKLADFGLSKRLSEPEVDQAAWHTYKCGTSFYMAPEVRQSLDNASESQYRYAKSADVFSFGTTCFNMLTRHEKPFIQKDLRADEFYEMINTGNVDQFVSEYGQSKIAVLVRECWCLNPAARPTFGTICQILEDEKRRILCTGDCWTRIVQYIRDGIAGLMILVLGLDGLGAGDCWTRIVRYIGDGMKVLWAKLERSFRTYGGRFTHHK